MSSSDGMNNIDMVRVPRPLTPGVLMLRQRHTYSISSRRIIKTAREQKKYYASLRFPSSEYGPQPSASRASMSMSRRPSQPTNIFPSPRSKSEIPSTTRLSRLEPSTSRGSVLMSRPSQHSQPRTLFPFPRPSKCEIHPGLKLLPSVSRLSMPKEPQSSTSRASMPRKPKSSRQSQRAERVPEPLTSASSKAMSRQPQPSTSRQVPVSESEPLRSESNVSGTQVERESQPSTSTAETTKEIEPVPKPKREKRWETPSRIEERRLMRRYYAGLKKQQEAKEKEDQEKERIAQLQREQGIVPEEDKGLPPLPPGHRHRSDPGSRKEKCYAKNPVGEFIIKAMEMERLGINPKPKPNLLCDGFTVDSYMGHVKSFADFVTGIANRRIRHPDQKKLKGQMMNYLLTPKVEFDPLSVKKVIIRKQDFTSFKGMRLFLEAVDINISEGEISDPDLTEYTGAEPIEKLYFTHLCLKTLMVPPFQHLKKLSVHSNKLTNLNFLQAGFPNMTYLNVAHNDITYVTEEQLNNCVNLESLNLSSNPLCTIQDIIAVRLLKKLKILLLFDLYWGKCPIVSICDGFYRVLTVLCPHCPNLKIVDDVKILPKDLSTIQSYINTRSLHYYSNSVKAGSKMASSRKQFIKSLFKRLEPFGNRLIELLSLAAQFRRIITGMGEDPCNMKPRLRSNLRKLELRESHLRQRSMDLFRRADIKLQISRWEQEVEKWTKWLEFQSFGSIRGALVYSVQGSVIPDWKTLYQNILELICALSCTNLWPKGVLVNVESVFVIRDRGLEAGMEMVFLRQVGRPKYRRDHIKPGLEYRNFLFFGKKGAKKPKTYHPNRVYPEYHHEFPYSIIGIPDMCEPVFMFLIVPPNTTPLFYLHEMMTGKSNNYADIRVTNCLWNAVAIRGELGCVVAIVVKVMAEYLQAETPDKRGCQQHGWDCTIFSLKRPLTITPAYILNISVIADDEGSYRNIPENDDDILVPTKKTMTKALKKLSSPEYPGANSLTFKNRKCQCLRKVVDGVEADLNALQLTVSQMGRAEMSDHKKVFEKGNQSTFEIKQVARLVGLDTAQYLTGLSLAGNKIGMSIGMDRLRSLKKLDLSHNNLTTLSGLQKLPQLQEFKVGWNYLRFFHSNVNTLASCTPGLQVLDLLPNTFQDIKDLIHIPQMLKRIIPGIRRVDHWNFPLRQYTSNSFYPPVVSVEECGFSHPSSNLIWGTTYACNMFAGASLYSLENLPVFPPIPQGFSYSGIDLNLSVNYLTTGALADSQFLRSQSWLLALVKLRLQDNLISNMDWVKGHVLSNVLILDLSNNNLTDLTHLAPAFPSVRHLHLGGNPLTDNTSIMAPLKKLTGLVTLDCDDSPLSKNLEYSGYVLKFLKSIQILDGKPISSYRLHAAVRRLGGCFCEDWRNTKLPRPTLETIESMSLADCNLQTVKFPPDALPKLLTLDHGRNKFANLKALKGFSNLRVLCLSHNYMEPIKIPRERKPPTPDRPIPQRIHRPISRGPAAEAAAQIRGRKPPGKTTKKNKPKTPVKKKRAAPPLNMPDMFPHLEVLIMSHNGLRGIDQFDLTRSKTLKTVILNCNSMKSLEVFKGVPVMTALVLDNNLIKGVPFNAFKGCENFRQLHLEQNRIAALPRHPHLVNLTSLYLSNNKIQRMSKLGCIPESAVTELTLAGNPVPAQSDYILAAAAKMPHLSTLKGKDLGRVKEPVKDKKAPLLKEKLQQKSQHKLAVKPKKQESGQATNMQSTVSKSTVIPQPGPVSEPQTPDKTVTPNLSLQSIQGPQTLKVSSLNPYLAKNSPRSHKLPSLMPKKSSTQL